MRREDVPADVIEAELQMQLRIVAEEGKPPQVAEKIVEGRMNKFFQEIVLLEQEFLKDDSKTIAQLLQEVVAETGESVQISRFAVFTLGEDSGAADAE